MLGSVGYMFSVSTIEHVLVSDYYAALQLPTYIADISDFLNTLNSLYQWKSHQVAMKDILLISMRKKENNARLAKLVPAHVSQIQSHGNASPNVFFLLLESDAIYPCKIKKRIIMALKTMMMRT